MIVQKNQNPNDCDDEHNHEWCTRPVYHFSICILFFLSFCSNSFAVFVCTFYYYFFSCLVWSSQLSKRSPNHTHAAKVNRRLERFGQLSSPVRYFHYMKIDCAIRSIHESSFFLRLQTIVWAFSRITSHFPLLFVFVLIVLFSFDSAVNCESFSSSLNGRFGRATMIRRQTLIRLKTYKKNQIGPFSCISGCWPSLIDNTIPSKFVIKS